MMRSALTTVSLLLVSLCAAHGSDGNAGSIVVDSVQPGSPAEADADADEATAQCLAWVESTYHIESMIEQLDLDLAEDYAMARACTARDISRMGPNAVKYCDNVFKVHCSGVDLLAEIGEAQVQRCEELLDESLGLRVKQYPGWKTCGQHKVFDRYSRSGEVSDADACKAALLDDCGTNIDAAIRADELSAEQRGFVSCCSADVLDAQSAGACTAVGDGLTRGPCSDRTVCVNKVTSEWLNCSTVQ